MSTRCTEQERRRFLQQVSAVGLSLSLPAWLAAADQQPTPRQTSGPFYPVPEIAKQKVHDTDLTRKLGQDELAKGQIISVNGEVKDVTGKPLKSAVVEIWQACTTGRYNHDRDNNPAKLDEDFQFWGRMTTGENGKYEFRTIKPGEYPGRTPHIHFKIIVPGYRELVTQMYFADESKSNAKDGLYRRLAAKERKTVTAELTKVTGKDAMSGKFDIWLAKR